MLIRNAMIDGMLTDLRLMHGRVQEIGVGLTKGLYESETDMMGDELRPCPPDVPLPRHMRRKAAGNPAGAHIMPGTPAPLARWHEGAMIGFIDEHAAD